MASDKTRFNQLFEQRDAFYQQPGHRFQALRLPPDGPVPLLAVLETINVDTPTLFHEPDLTPFWDSGYTVDYRMLELKGQRDKKLDGIYYRFEATTDSRPDANKQFVGAKGGVLIKKMHPLEFGRGSKALYIDMSEDWQLCEGLQSYIDSANLTKTLS